MAYSYFCVKKLHSSSQLIASYNHNFRKYNVENASKEKRCLNQELVGNGELTYLESFNKRCEELKLMTGKSPLRKNGVMAFEIVCSITHPEENLRINLDEWKKECVEFVKEKFNKNPGLYGENVISAVYHGDEQSPHIHMIVLPVAGNGKFAASPFYNGKFELGDIREQYAQRMYDYFNLEKGVEHSITKHQYIKDFYDELNQNLDVSDVPRMEPGKNIEEHNRELENVFTKIRAGDFRRIKERDYKIQRLESRLANTEKELKKELENENLEKRILSRMSKKMGGEKKLYEDVEFMIKLKLYLEVSKDPEVSAQYKELKKTVDDFCEKYLNRDLYTLDLDKDIETGKNTSWEELELEQETEQSLAFNY